MKIWFFTGTGNSYWVARRLTEMAKKDGIEASNHPIDHFINSDVRKLKTDDLTGFVYPTHGFTTPWYMLKFMLAFPRGKGDIFLINNRAGMKLSKMFTPGVSGIALLLPIFIFFLKGYRIRGVMPVDNPSNWITVHPGLKKSVVNSIFERRQHDLDRLWARLKQGKLFYHYKFFILLPLDLYLGPISLGYMVVARILFAKSLINDTSCDGCSLCAKRCPVGAIKMQRGKPFWTYRCESCMRCSNVCPKKSINSSIPLMFLYGWGMGFLLAHLPFMKTVFLYTAMAGKTVDFLAHVSVSGVTAFIVTIVLYRIIYFIAGLKPLSWLIAHSTPMKYWRRYILPGFKGIYK